MELKEKIIVITGGSQGFGKELAKLFVLEKSNVIICSQDKSNLEKTSNEIGCDFFLADVTSFDDMKALGKDTFDKYGKIDIWINNAGIQIAPSKVENIDIKKIKHLFDVNFFGYFYGCQVAIPYMNNQKGGTILNVNSTAGLEGKPNISAYSSSKFAIKGLTESIRKEIKDSNIKIFEVFPGGMQTDIYKEQVPDDIKAYMEVNFVAKKVVENLKLNNPEVDLVIKRPSR